jgi:hypothetical protein
VEVFTFFPNFIRISQRNPEKALTARFECDDVLAGGEDNPPERHHPFLTDRLTNNSERLLADFAIGDEIIGDQTSRFTSRRLCIVGSPEGRQGLGNSVANIDWSPLSGPGGMLV